MEAIGEEINRKETINYIKILTEKYQIADSMTLLARSKSDAIQSPADKVNKEGKIVCYLMFPPSRAIARN